MKKFLLSFIIVALSFAGIAQPAATTTYNGNTGIPQNTNVNTGQVVYLDTVSGSINLNGGIIVINGPVSLVNSNFNNGTIYVQTNAVFNISGNLQGPVINNSGLINVSGNVNLQQTYTTSQCASLVISGVYSQSNGVLLQGAGLIKVSGSNLNFSNGAIATAGSVIVFDYTASAQFNVNNHQYTPSALTSADFSTISSYLNVTFHTTNDPTSVCTTITPVLLINVTAELNNGALAFNWTSTSETNNAYYVVEGSADAKTWVEVGKIDTYWPNGTGSVSHTYSFSFYDLITTEAGMSSILGAILVLGMIGGLVSGKGRKVALTLLVVVLSATMFSCHKTNDLKTQNSVRYSYFRLKSVDLDGTVHYYQTVFKVK